MRWVEEHQKLLVVGLILLLISGGFIALLTIVGPVRYIYWSDEEHGGIVLPLTTRTEEKAQTITWQGTLKDASLFIRAQPIATSVVTLITLDGRTLYECPLQIVCIPGSAIEVRSNVTTIIGERQGSHTLKVTHGPHPSIPFPTAWTSVRLTAYIDIIYDVTQPIGCGVIQVCHTLTVTSTPEGIPISANGIQKTTPFTMEIADGTGVTLVAPQEITVGLEKFQFQGWSLGSAERTVTFTMNSDTTAVANYVAIGTNTTALVWIGAAALVFIGVIVLLTRRGHSPIAIFTSRR